MKLFNKTLIMALVVFISAQILNNEAYSRGMKKKIFMGTIQGINVSQAIVKRVTGGISSVIIDSEEYIFIDEDAVKNVLKGEELAQAISCSDEQCIKKIADQMRSDEMIFGTIQSEDDELRLIVKNLEKDEDFNYTIKSMVNIKFKEINMNHYSREAGKKLINRNYKIMPIDITAISRKVDIAKLKFRSVKGVDVTIMDFESDDNLVSGVLSVVKKYVQEGDEKFEDKKYDGAIGKYEEVITKINKNIPPAKIVKLKEFIDKVNQRIINSLYMKYYARVADVDSKIAGKEEVDLKTLEDSAALYGSIRSDIEKDPDNYKDKKINTLYDSLFNRIDLVFVAMVDFLVKEGKIYLMERKFEGAREYFAKGDDKSAQIYNEKLRRKQVDRCRKAMDAAEKSGQNFLASRVSYMVNMAMVKGIENETEAREIMVKARDYIVVHRRFITDNIFKEYNDYAKLKNFPELPSLDEMKKEAEIAAARENERREQERLRREAEMREQARLLEEKAARMSLSSGLTFKLDYQYKFFSDLTSIGDYPVTLKGAALPIVRFEKVYTVAGWLVFGWDLYLGAMISPVEFDSPMKLIDYYDEDENLIDVEIVNGVEMVSMGFRPLIYHYSFTRNFSVYGALGLEYVYMVLDTANKKGLEIDTDEEFAALPEAYVRDWETDEMTTLNANLSLGLTAKFGPFIMTLEYTRTFYASENTGHSALTVGTGFHS